MFVGSVILWFDFVLFLLDEIVLVVDEVGVFGCVLLWWFVFVDLCGIFGLFILILFVDFLELGLWLFLE